VGAHHRPPDVVGDVIEQRAEVAALILGEEPLEKRPRAFGDRGVAHGPMLP
jgi:hypothetical protein